MIVPMWFWSWHLLLITPRTFTCFYSVCSTHKVFCLYLSVCICESVTVVPLQSCLRHRTYSLRQKQPFAASSIPFHSSILSFLFILPFIHSFSFFHSFIPFHSSIHSFLCILPFIHYFKRWPLIIFTPTALPRSWNTSLQMITPIRTSPSKQYKFCVHLWERVDLYMITPVWSFTSDLTLETVEFLLLYNYN